MSSGRFRRAALPVEGASVSVGPTCGLERRPVPPRLQNDAVVSDAPRYSLSVQVL